MKLNVRTGDAILITGKPHKVIKIDELDFSEKVAANISPQTIARRLTLEDKQELIFLGC